MMRLGSWSNGEETNVSFLFGRRLDAPSAPLDMKMTTKIPRRRLIHAVKVTAP
jgi:hypothetical protein